MEIDTTLFHYTDDPSKSEDGSKETDKEKEFKKDGEGDLASKEPNKKVESEVSDGSDYFAYRR